MTQRTHVGHKIDVEIEHHFSVKYRNSRKRHRPAISELGQENNLYRTEEKKKPS